MQKKLLILVAVLIMSGVSAFAEWVFIGSGGGVKLEVESAKIRKKSDGIIVWEKFTFTNQDAKQNAKNGSNLQSLPDYYLLQVKYDVDNDRHMSLSQVFYDSDGASIKSITPDNPKWEPIIPHSLGEAVLDYLINLEK